ncbi:MAG: hypothetical protein LUG16_06115 [Candidatus Gastranaerophilales bacterium]|nr:hypothetical protein [Candidatus Gastranaerophilales bacterium]
MSMSISQQQVTQKFGQEYIDAAKEGLALRDENGDGQTSAIEMYKDISNVYSSVFRGNEEYSQRAQELALAQGEVYAKYAGDDGILDEYEYAEALNSDENNALLEQYWELKDSMEAQNGEEEIIGLSRHDTNNDGQTSVIEMFKDKIDLYS